jgi:NAD(P)H dehydrogenase (quinone)
MGYTMNALLVVAHPNGASFSHAMASVARSVLAEAGYVLLEHDLYVEGFNPVQQTIESANTSSTDPLVEQHCDHLRNADLILIFHPNWWSQPPAIMKGWIDRVFRLDTAYGYPEGVGYDGVPIGLLKAKYALVFNTSNTQAHRENEVFGDPLECLWRTSVFALCGIHDVKRGMFGPMASSTETQRASWLNEVRDVVQNAIENHAQTNR